jgi:hypothetical protein
MKTWYKNYLEDNFPKTNTTRHISPWITEWKMTRGRLHERTIPPSVRRRSDNPGIFDRF